MALGICKAYIALSKLRVRDIRVHFGVLAGLQVGGAEIARISANDLTFERLFLSDGFQVALCPLEQ
jgi:hypothetical protein